MKMYAGVENVSAQLTTSGGLIHIEFRIGSGTASHAFDPSESPRLLLERLESVCKMLLAEVRENDRSEIRRKTLEDVARNA